MKKSETDALKKAFNIPEPERKNEFTSSFKEKVKKNKLRFPVIMRYVSVAAMAAIVIGLWDNLSKTGDFRDKFGDTAIFTETTAVSSYENKTDITVNTTSANIVTSQPTYNNISLTTTVTISENIPQSSTESTPVKTLQPESTSPHYINNTEYTPALQEPEPNKAEQTDTSESVNTTVQHTVPLKEPTVTTTVRSTVIPPVTATTTSINIETPSIVTTTPLNYEDSSIVITTTEPLNQSDAGEDIFRDLTVTPTVQYEKNGIIIDSSELIEKSLEPPDGKDNILSIDKMKSDSDYIVYASIENIIYTSIDGKPYTQENLAIRAIYKGDARLYVMDRISLYIPGGYMPAEEYILNNGGYLKEPENYVVYDTGGNQGSQETGDEFIFFIKEADTSYPKGAYVLTINTDISIFDYVNKEYVSIGDESLTFTSDFLN